MSDALAGHDIPLLSLASSCSLFGLNKHVGRNFPVPFYDLNRRFRVQYEQGKRLRTLLASYCLSGIIQGGAQGGHRP